MNWQLPPTRPGHEASGALQDIRDGVDRAESSLSGPATVVTAESIGGVSCTIVSPPSFRRRLLYLHGGGYGIGRPAFWTPIASRLALAIEAQVILADYRLAPENPFPAALHDAAAVYGCLLGADPAPLLCGGDSAGGGLAAALTVACTISRVPVPDAVVLFSPWLDLTLEAPSHRSRADSDEYFPPTRSTEAAGLYLQGCDPRDPLASPIFADLSGFPPTFLTVATEETLLDDSLTFSCRLAEGRTSVTLIVAPGMPHAWPVLLPDHAQSEAVISGVKLFVETLPSRTFGATQ